MATAILPRDTRVVPTLPVRRFSLREYHRLAEVGVLTPADRIELINGWVGPKVTHNPPHDGTGSIASRRLKACLPSGWIVRTQSSITLPKDSEPEPDLAVVLGPEELYLRKHPLPHQIGLLVEVADTSLAQDQKDKVELYARDRIP